MNKRKLLLAYLKKNRLLSLGTTAGKKPWSATVFFAYDKKYNFLFYSRSNTRHAKNINKNPWVSGTINQDWGEPGFVRGVQFVGKVKKVPEKELKKWYAILKKRHPWAERYKDHSLYRITPEELYYIDHKKFGHFFRVRII